MQDFWDWELIHLEKDYYFECWTYLLASDFDCLTLISYWHWKYDPCSKGPEPNACMLCILGRLVLVFDLHDEFLLKEINSIETLDLCSHDLWTVQYSYSGSKACILYQYYYVGYTLLVPKLYILKVNIYSWDYILFVDRIGGEYSKIQILNLLWAFL